MIRFDIYGVKFILYIKYKVAIFWTILFLYIAREESTVCLAIGAQKNVLDNVQSTKDMDRLELCKFLRSKLFYGFIYYVFGTGIIE